MSHAAVALLLVSLAAQAAPQAAPVPAAPAVPLTIELEVSRERAFVGEAVEVVVRVTWDPAWLADHALQPFQQPLDLPLQVVAPALLGGDGWTTRAPSWAERGASISGARTLALGEQRIAVAPPAGQRDGVLELRRFLLADRAGTFELPAAKLHAVVATRFEEDLLQGRIAIDRRDVTLETPARRITIDALPDQGRPATFGGAVGPLTIEAAVAPAAVTLGEPLAFTATLRGAANFEQLAAPHFAPAGFHVRGRTLARAAGAMSVTWELLPLSTAVTAVPSLAIDWFDPGPPTAWRIARSGSLALRVAPAADGATRIALPDASAPVVPAEELALLAPLKRLEESAAAPRSTWFERSELGRRACRDGDFVRAAAWYRAALTEPGAPAGPLRFNLGHALYAQERVAEALAEWLRAARSLRDDAGLVANVALAARRLGEADATARWFALGEADAAALRDYCREPSGRCALVTADGGSLLPEPTADWEGAVPAAAAGTLLRVRAASPRWVELDDGRWIARADVVLLD